MEIKYYKVSQVEAEGLIQLLEWLPDVEEEIEFLEKEFKRISCQEGRVVKAVRYANRITLFVDDLTGRRNV